jgi:hypothetical protein
MNICWRQLLLEMMLPAERLQLKDWPLIQLQQFIIILTNIRTLSVSASSCLPQVLRVFTYHAHYSAHACLRNHDLLNYRTDTSKTDIFRKLRIQHWHAVSFVFNNSFSKKLIFNKKNLTLKIGSASSTGSHRKYIKYVSFPWPPVVAEHHRKRLAQVIGSRSVWIR